MTPNTLLLRQIHASFVQQGRVTSQAFRPTAKDEDQLSTYDGDRIEPEAAWSHYTTTLGFSSVGVLAVTVGECGGLGLPARPEPTFFPEHAVIDFAGLSSGKVEKAAKQLRHIAQARGWLFQAA